MTTPPQKPKRKHNVIESSPAVRADTAAGRVAGYVVLVGIGVLLVLWSGFGMWQALTSDEVAVAVAGRQVIDVEARQDIQARTEAGVNLFSNPSFELDPTLMDFGWQIDARGTDLDARWSDAHARTGRYSLALKTSQPGNRGWPGWFATVPVTSGFGYTFSAQTFSPDGASGWLVIALYDGDGGLRTSFSTGCREWEEGWVMREVAVDLQRLRDANAATMRLGLLQCLNYSEGTATTLYVDDVALVPMKP